MSKVCDLTPLETLCGGICVIKHPGSCVTKRNSVVFYPCFTLCVCVCIMVYITVCYGGNSWSWPGQTQ